MREQKRLVEAARLAARIERDINIAKTALLARLHEYRKQNGWHDTRVSAVSDGTFRIELQDLAVSDLSILKGQPVSELNLAGSNITDLRSIAEISLKKLTSQERK